MQIYSDDEIIRLIDQYMDSSEHPDLKGYREQTRQRDFADKGRFLWALKYVAKLGDYHNKRILDVGCGMGWQAFTIALLDAGNKVTAIDILPSMIDAMKECVDNMHKTGVNFNITPMCGDICNLNIEAASFDSIYSIEAIEHVHDMKQMIQRCYSVLRPKGTLILVNDANILNRSARAEVVDMWNERENSWKWAEFLRSIRPIEHGEARPFAVMREEIVRAANPNLDERAVKSVVGATAGLLKADIERFAISYKPGMALPTRPKYDWCRNPLTGEYAERLFDPFALAKQLTDTGFKTKVGHFFRRFPLSLANSMQFRALNRLLFNVRPHFVIYGEKA
jgi:2-polyprenyl-3-methyl-5-hydroxy-6-metoxy-1,4-benzoquinol methylase